MGRKRFPSDRSEQCRSKALGFGNYPSAVSTRSSSFLSRNLQLRHPGPRGDLGVHGQLSTAEPRFQRLLLALPCLGTWLGTAWEPAGGVYQPTLGLCSKEGWQEGCSTVQRGAGGLSPLVGTGFVAEVMVGDAYAATGLSSPQIILGSPGS